MFTQRHLVFTTTPFFCLLAAITSGVARDNGRGVATPTRVVVIFSSACYAIVDTLTFLRNVSIAFSLRLRASATANHETAHIYQAAAA